MKTTILLLSIFILAQSSCNTDDGFTPTLPPITQTGENTFGCYVDGVLVTPRNGKSSTLGPAPGMIFWGSPDTQEIPYDEIDIKDYKSDARGRVKIHFINLDNNGEGAFTINESNCYGNLDSPISLNIYSWYWNSSTQTYKWYCSIKEGGILNISRHDTINGIFSGTFSCRAVNRDNPNEFIEITQGRFDINRTTLNFFTDFP